MTIQRLEEMSPNFLQLMRILLATNLTTKGQISNANEQLENLVKKVSNIETGIKFASGTVNTNGAWVWYELLNSTNTESSYEIEVAGLDFEPNFIFAHGDYPTGTGNLNNPICVYSKERIFPGYPEKQIFTSTIVTHAPVGTTYNPRGFKTTGRAYVNSTGFRLPIAGTSLPINWFAIS